MRRLTHLRARMQQMPWWRSATTTGQTMWPLVAVCVCVALIGGAVIQPCGAYSVRPNRQQQQQQQQASAGTWTENGINGAGCPQNRLVAYKVVLHTYWSRELFPKHYPDWRPAAQWTKTVGKLNRKCVCGLGAGVGVCACVPDMMD